MINKKQLFIVFSSIFFNIFSMQRDNQVLKIHKIANQSSLVSWVDLPVQIQFKILEKIIESIAAHAASCHSFNDDMLKIRLVHPIINSLLEENLTAQYIINLANKFSVNIKPTSFFILAKILLSGKKFCEFEKVYKRDADKLGKRFIKKILEIISSHFLFYYSEVKELTSLVTHGVNINFKDACGNTALIHSILSGRNDIVQMLIDLYADLNIRDTHGCSPITIAALYHNTDIVKVLIEGKANLNSQNIVGNSALTTAILNSSIVRSDSFAFWNTVKILIAAKIDLNLQDIDGNTALVSAVYSHNLKLIKLLLSAGANPKIKNNQGKTAYDIALETGNYNIQHELMLAAGSKL